MSFISITLSENFLTIVSDGRSTELKSDGTLGEVTDENAIKLSLLSDTSFFCLVGSSEDAIIYLSDSKLYELLDEKGLLIEDALGKWFEDNIHLIKGLKFSVSFGGITSSNKLKVFSIDSEIKVLQELTYKKDRMGYSLFCSRNVSNNHIDKVFNEILDEYPLLNMDNVLESQYRLNDIVADIDKSVNKNKNSLCFQL